MVGIPSIYEAFRDKKTVILIPKTPAANPSSKVRSVPLPKSAQSAAAAAAAVDAVESGVAASDHAVIVDLGDIKKTPASYGAVFTSEADDGVCWHCRQQVGPDKVGIPLRIRDDRFHHLLIVDIEGRACDASCALAFIQDHVGEHSCYEGREVAMHQINEICNPGTTLLPARNWRLLKCNGGPMTPEEFKIHSRRLVPTPNLQFRLCSLTFGPA